MKDRLNQVINYSEMTVNAFANTIGVSQSGLRQFLVGQSMNMSTNTLVNLHKEFPNIDLHWLITGEGTMLRDEEARKLKKIKSLSLLEQLADILNNL